MILKLTNRAVDGAGCSAEEALALVSADEKALFDGATRIRKSQFGNDVQLCSIVNARSGRCDMDCRFCSQSGHSSTEIETYPFMDGETLKSRITETLSSGDRFCGVVTSGGRLSSEELEALVKTVQEIGDGEKVPVCASLGRLRAEDFSVLKKAGITRFHHNLETSEEYYPKICSTQQWVQRVDTVRDAMAAGLNVCSGGLFGLGESWEDRINLALSLRELGVDSVPINFLYAHSGTPLKDMPPLSAEEALRIIAIYRFLLPTATLRICGGRAHVLGDRQDELFSAGANGMMTGSYLTVSGSQYEDDLAMIHRLGLRIVSSEFS